MKEYGNKNEGQRRLDSGIRKNEEEREMRCMGWGRKY